MPDGNKYELFLERKVFRVAPCGIEPQPTHPVLFPFQADIVRRALRLGRSAVFADCGLGKTLISLEWARQIPGRVLLVAPLCVSEQTIREARKVGLSVSRPGGGSDIDITNYERLHQIEPGGYAGVVLDESSILKAHDGKTKQALIEMWARTPYRLCCTATPAPNDVEELTNHVEFLGIMPRQECLGAFFVHDEDGWRLRGHATDAFWRFVASWAVLLRTPEDLGYAQNGFQLPTLVAEVLRVDSGASWFGAKESGLRGRQAARRGSVAERVAALTGLVRFNPGPWIVYCGLNAEQDAAAAALDGECVSVSGQDDADEKTEKLLDFLDGRRRVLVSKPRIAGFGMNFQHCHQIAFLGMGDSYEQFYQCVRRCHRFGQAHPVVVKVLLSDAEMPAWENVQRKQAEAARMTAGVLASLSPVQAENMRGAASAAVAAPSTRREAGETWEMVLGDACEELRRFPEGAAHLAVFSPPFLSLFAYTDSARDLGNSRSPREFYRHFAWVANGLRRCLAPGRLAVVHVAQPASTLAHDGIIGLKDLRGGVIRVFQRCGFAYHGEVAIDKNPQAQAIRTHAKALLFAQLHKDAAWLRPALADFLLLFRAPGENAVPVLPDITNEDWIEWARPVWTGIRESDTLNAAEARGPQDDRHVCPLQLGVIARAVRLWSNPGETILSPFAGIGSEGYEAVRLGRRFVGIELKPEYFNAAVRNLRDAEDAALRQMDLFGSGAR